MRILIVDDDVRFAQTLARVLRSGGYADVRTATSGEDALDMLQAGGCDLLVTDLRMKGMDGLTLLAEVRRRVPSLRVILMTAFADVTTARLALKKGAMDYLVKPFDNKELLDLVEQVGAGLPAGGSSGAGSDAFSGLVGRSPAMQAVYERIRKAANSDASVLVLGESGTGKELVARSLHRLSGRHAAPFVVVHAPAIPETLLESELFGHERGAFTGADARRIGHIESAHGGTVFFDEIADMPLALQPKILRFLQERQFTRLGGRDVQTVDVRVLAATNRDLERETREGRFREDLFYRLDVLRIELPPLRARAEDVPLLVAHLLGNSGRSLDDISPDAMGLLQAYDWPGNVRELQNVIERALVECGDAKIGVSHLPEKMRVARVAESPGRDLDMQANERRIIEEALAKASGNKSRAAELLGITRRKLYSRMERLGMKID